MRKYFAIFIFAIAIIILLNACQKLLPSGPAENEVVEGTIEGLTSAQLRNFMAGDEIFNTVYSKEDGLGPIFIQSSCAGCHVGDGKGHPFTMITRFGKQTDAGFNYMTEQGGGQLQQRAIAGYKGEELPTGYTHKTERLAPIVVGNGYLAAVHDSTLINLSDSSDLDGDGISGRPNFLIPKEHTEFDPNIHLSFSDGKYIGRFGKKAKEATLLDQVVFALKQDIGITSDFDTEDLYNTVVGKFSGDDVPDPEVSASVVRNLVFYQRTLRAPMRRNEDDADVLAGEQLFADIGCVKCHVPTMKTAKSDIEVLSEVEFHAYTDLLIHDMGSVLDDGYPEGVAKGSEWRTPPLWGLGLAKDSQGGEMFLLHDGRASTIAEAVQYHMGEALTVANNFFALSNGDQEKIVKFLESL